MREKANEGEQMMMDIIMNNMEGDDMKDLELTQKLAEKYPKSARACDHARSKVSRGDPGV